MRWRSSSAPKEHDDFGWGNWHLVDASAPSVCALRYAMEGRTTVAVHKLSCAACTTNLDLAHGEQQELTEMPADSACPESAERRESLRLGPFGGR
jgi:hypothetical protein